MRMRVLRGAAVVLFTATMTASAQSQSLSAQLERDLLQASARRHNMALTYGIPAQYAAMRNPLPNATKTWQRGAVVYAQRCATCHGAAGQGDGPSGSLLPSPPANLAWFAALPMSQWDGFVYWSIAEGGRPFGTAMPAYKKVMSKKDIWAVTAYINQALGKTRRS